MDTFGIHLDFPTVSQHCATPHIFVELSDCFRQTNYGKELADECWKILNKKVGSQVGDY